MLLVIQIKRIHKWFQFWGFEIKLYTQEPEIMLNPIVDALGNTSLPELEIPDDGESLPQRLSRIYPEKQIVGTVHGAYGHLEFTDDGQIQIAMYER